LTLLANFSALTASVTGRSFFLIAAMLLIDYQASLFLSSVVVYIPENIAWRKTLCATRQKRHHTVAHSDAHQNPRKEVKTLSIWHGVFMNDNAWDRSLMHTVTYHFPLSDLALFLGPSFFPVVDIALMTIAPLEPERSD
jgi:hypothetical protein